MNEAADVLEAVRKAMPPRCPAQRLVVEGLQLEVRAVDRALLRWVQTFMHPLGAQRRQRSDQHYAVTYLHDDELLLWVLRQLRDFELVRVHRYGSDSFVRRVCLSAQAVLYCDPDEGLVWISALDTRTVHIVASSRTRYPTLALARVVGEVLTRYLAEQGWTLFHAGAMAAPGGALMVVGYSGAGKTTLLLALMCGGLALIANEMLYVRSGARGVQVLNYPKPIAIGLGTLLQLSGVASLVQSHEELLYPRLRFSMRSLMQTPRADWPGLDDKLQLLSGELSTRLGAPPAQAGGTLRAVVVPKVSKTALALTVRPLASEKAAKVLAGNHIGLDENSKHPPWMELAFGPPNTAGNAQLLAQLAQLQPLQMGFGLAAEVPENTLACAPALMSALRQVS